MKRIYLQLTLAIFICQLAYANQIQIEQLKNQLSSLRKAEKVDSLNKLGALLLAGNNAEKARLYLLESIKIAEREAYPEGLALAYDGLAETYIDKLDFMNAMKYYVDALRIKDKTADKSGVAGSKHAIGLLFLKQENTIAALNNLQEALLIWRELADYGGIAAAEKAIGDTYLFKKVYGKAQAHYKNAQRLLIELNVYDQAAGIARKHAYILKDMGDYEGAFAQYQMSLDLFRAANIPEEIANCHYDLAVAKLEDDEPEEALEQIEQSMVIWSGKADRINLARGELLLAGISEGKKSTGAAKAHLKKSSEYLKGSENVGEAYGLYKEIASVYAKIKDYDKAYGFQRDYDDKRNIYFTKEKSKALLELTTKYESEFEAEKQRLKIVALEKEKSYNKKISYFLRVLLGLLLILLVVSYRNYKRKKADNELLKVKNKEIQLKKEEIKFKNEALKVNNDKLDSLNHKLVAEMAERENIENSNLMRGSFLASMANEVRNPLNNIIGMTHLLLDENLTPDQVENLRSVQYAANNLIVYINDVLDFSKIEAGKLNLDSRPFSPISLFSELSARFSQKAKEKKLGLECIIDSKLPAQLMGDPARLDQILTQLLTNAIKYTDEGLVRISVSLVELNSVEAKVKIEVTDTGRGMAKAKLKSIFKKAKVSSGGTPEFNDYGNKILGLPMTKRLIELQNGRISVISEVGKGSNFEIKIPIKLIPKEMVNKQLNYNTQASTNLSGKCILLVEDNKINQLVVSKMLRKHGVDVVCANNGLEAIRSVEQQDFDLILMDIQMPKMDGYRATAEIRKMKEPSKRDVPIIALTASAFLSEKEKARLFGMNDHVGKPFGPDDLLEKLNNCLSVYRAYTDQSSGL